MLAQKVKRIHNQQLVGLTRACPQATNQSQPMKSTGYMHYNEAKAGWEVQYWCAEHQKLHLVKDMESDKITTWLVQNNNLDSWVKSTRGESFLYSERFRGQTTRCPICEKTTASATGNLYYSKPTGWVPEYWCPYDEELFTKWDRDKDPMIKEVTKDVEVGE